MPERERWRDHALRATSGIASTTMKSIGPSVQKYWDERSHKKHDKKLSAVTNPLIYTPLPTPTSIRLLTIHPGPACSILYTTLRTADLASYPQYTALSYTWELGASWKSTTFNILRPYVTGELDDKSLVGVGDETKKRIICNNQIAELQPNLYACMLYMRKHGIGEVWIDALCMNQEDDDENGVQVPLMGRIYGQAERTVVWLGDCPSFLSPGISALRAWSGEGSLAKKEPAAIMAVLYLLSRRWFRRLWVLQEMCIPPALTFWFGSHELSETDLINALEAIKATLRDAVAKSWAANKFSSFMMRRWGGQLRYFPDNVKLRELYQRGERWSLEEWMLATKGRMAKDPRDLVYGGMAIIQPEALRIDTSLQLPPTSPPDPHDITMWEVIRVDYSTPVPTLLTQLAACLLSQPGAGLSLLSISARSRDYDEMDEYWDPLTKTKKGPLPSWIPNPGNEASLAVEMFASQGGHHFKACLRESGTKISADGSKLFIDVVRLGVIEGPNWESNSIESDAEDPEGINTLLRIFAGVGFTDHSFNYGGILPEGFSQWFVDLPEVYGKGLSMFEVLARVITGGMARKSRGKEDDLLASGGSLPASREKHSVEPLMSSQALRTGLCGLLASYMGKLDQELRRVSGGQDEEQIEQALRFVSKETELYDQLKKKYPQEKWWRDGEERSEEERDDARDFSQAQGRAMWGRAIKKTGAEDGGTIVLAPSCVEKGDVVMLVKGAYVPYIFTPYEVFVQRLSDRLKQWKTIQVEDSLTMNTLAAELKLAETRVKAAEENLAAKGGGWILVGEAYVEGFMNGEADGSSDYWFERIAIV
ncbi:heterokaryon incompatibility protein-domain-containing protein [Xylaria arbuscula]|nr:heterokaryon incompatibility protein-domain-containing protein [Xylaria arbuscula]